MTTRTPPPAAAREELTSEQRRATRVLLGLLLPVVMAVVGLAAWGVTYQVTSFRYDTAAIGTPGMFTAHRCGSEPATNGKPYWVCSGGFVSLDGRSSDPSVSLDQSLPVGRAVPMQRETGGGYTRPTALNAVGDITLLLLTLAMACLALTGTGYAARALVLHLAGPSRGGGGGWSALVALCVRATLAAAGLTLLGAATCAVLDLI